MSTDLFVQERTAIPARDIKKFANPIELEFYQEASRTWRVWGVGEKQQTAQMFISKRSHHQSNCDDQKENMRA